MVTGMKGIDLIKYYEKFEPKAYVCPAGKLTIGYGHVILKGDYLDKDSEIDEERAIELLQKDLEIAENEVNKLENVRELKQNMYDALISFTFNCGIGAFRKSTLRKRVLSEPENYEEISYQLSRWTRGGGKVLPGLVKRREKEAELYRE